MCHILYGVIILILGRKIRFCFIFKVIIIAIFDGMYTLFTYFMFSARCKGRLLWEKGQIEDLYSELESGKLDCKIKAIYGL